MRNERADFRTEIAPLDRAIVDQAKEIPDCKLWMNRADAPVPQSPNDYEVVGHCFETLAEAISLVRIVLTDLSGRKSHLTVAMQLVAESQSALRSAVERIDGPSDHDQIAIFLWLRATAATRRILVERFLVSDDQAEPEGCQDLQGRIESFRLTVVQTQRRELRKQALLGTLSHISDRLLCCDDSIRHRLWDQAAKTTEELISLGVPPSDRQLRDVLLPVIDDAPKMRSESQAIQLVQREIDRVRNRITSTMNGRRLSV